MMNVLCQIGQVLNSLEIIFGSLCLCLVVAVEEMVPVMVNQYHWTYGCLNEAVPETVTGEYVLLRQVEYRQDICGSGTWALCQEEESSVGEEVSL